MMKKTISLFLIFFVLLLWYLIYEGKISKKIQEKKSSEKKVLRMDKEKIKEILIKNEENEIHLVKEKNKWIIKNREVLDADKDEMDIILNKLVSLEIERNLGKVEELEQYGLKDGRKKIEIETEDGKTAICIGDETPAGSYLYATKDKQEVFLISKWEINSILEKKIFDLRDKRIIPAEILTSEVKEIEIKSKKDYLLLKKENRRWNIIEPLNDWADEDKIQEIFHEIIEGKVKNFEDKSGKEAGVERPRMTIRIKDDKNNYFLYIGKKSENGYYAKTSIKPYIFSIDTNIVERISLDPEDWRSRKIFTFEDVEEISIKRKAEEIKIIKEKENYILEKDKNKKVSKEKVEEFLFDLKYLSIKDFIGYSENLLQKYNLLNPEIKISLLTESGRIEVSFGEKIEDNVYCYTPLRKLIFTIPSSDWEKIDKKEDFFIEKGKRKK